MDELRRLRKMKGLTQVELAEQSGVSAYTITEIETGHRDPRPSTLRKLASVLDADVADFFPKARPDLPVEEPVGAGKGEAPAGSGQDEWKTQRLLWRVRPWTSYLESSSERFESMSAAAERGLLERGAYVEASTNADNVISALKQVLAGLDDEGLQMGLLDERGKKIAGKFLEALSRWSWRLGKLDDRSTMQFASSEFEQARKKRQSALKDLEKTAV